MDSWTSAYHNWPYLQELMHMRPLTYWIWHWWWISTWSEWMGLMAKSKCYADITLQWWLHMHLDHLLINLMHSTSKLKLFWCTSSHMVLHQCMQSLWSLINSSHCGCWFFKFYALGRPPVCTFSILYWTQWPLDALRLYWSYLHDTTWGVATVAFGQ
jgi:hypothetical protein